MQQVPNIVRLCQEGQLEAFSALFDHYRQYIFGVAKAILRDEEAAEDVVQDTFLAVFEKITSFKGESAFETWLTAIAANICRMRLRRWKIRQSLPLDLLSPRRLLGVGGQIERMDELMHRKQRREALWDLVDQLPDRQRLPMIFRYRYGLACQEIAMILKRRTSTIYQDLHAGRQQLMEMARRLEKEEPAARTEVRVEAT